MFFMKLGKMLVYGWSVLRSSEKTEIMLKCRPVLLKILVKTIPV